MKRESIETVITIRIINLKYFVALHFQFSFVMQSINSNILKSAPKPRNTAVD